MAKKNKRLIEQAALESLVRFGPQLDALESLTQTAKDSFSATVGAANVSAASTQAAIKEARPGLRKTYDQAGLAQAALNDTLLSGDLAGLEGPGTDLLKAAGATEAHRAASQMNAAKVQALQELTNRGIQAQAGRSQAVLAANARLHDDLLGVERTRQSIAGQAGAFTAATLGDLLETRADRRFTAGQKELDRENQAALNRADNRTSRANTRDRIDAAAAKDAAKDAEDAKGLLPNGVKKATPQQHGAARDGVELALTQAKRLKASGRDRGEIAQLLTEGRSSQTVENDAGEKVKVPGVSKVPQLLAQAALDIMYYGFVSKKTRRLLNARGLTVGGLRYPGPNSPQAKGWRAKRIAQKAVGPIAATGVGGSVGAGVG